MGTKNNPGKFDCYANAEPDEPMFVLLGRDKHAPMLVYLWARLRQIDSEDPDKIIEALDCASAMIKYLKTKGKEPFNALYLHEIRTQVNPLAGLQEKDENNDT